MPIIPRQNDVLLGKGTAINSHPGNKLLRCLVDQFQRKYSQSEREVKRTVAADVVKEFQSSGGIFLMEDRKSQSKGKISNGTGGSVNNVHPSILAKVWVEAPEDKVIEKVMHRLRQKDKSLDTEQQKCTQGKAPKIECENDDGQQEVSDTVEDGPRGLQFDARTALYHDGESKMASTSLHMPPVVDEQFEVDQEVHASEHHEAASLAPTDCDFSDLDLTQFDWSIHDECKQETESSNHDEELDNLLCDFSSQHYSDQHSSEHLHEESMREWIKKSKSKVAVDVMGQMDAHTNSKHSGSVLVYVKSALPIALKMTECLIEAEKVEQSGERNPIPLASIKADNVLVRSKEEYEVIDCVSVLSCLGDDQEAGDSLSRLSSLGLVLYGLFAGEERLLEGHTSIHGTPNMLSFNSIGLYSNKESNCGHPRNKILRSEDTDSKYIAKLKTQGVPQSICDLIGNLLDCSQGDSRRDDAYSTLVDVKSDLQRMLYDPSRFLNDIEVCPLPSLCIPDKLYGRDKEKETLEKSYQRHFDGDCGGVVITGKSGVGKSSLAKVAEKLSFNSNGYFLSAKFDQAQDVFPLATISSLFNSLIDQVAQDTNDVQLKAINAALESALGSQAMLLDAIVPSLPKLMPSHLSLGHTRRIDASMSIQHLFGELLCIIASHAGPRISIFLDDLQWIDIVSLQLVGSLISSNEVAKTVFFICAYRDDEVHANEAFNQWLGNTPMASFETIKLGNISLEGANHLISDSLHTSSRITRPLASVLHHKTGGGNPFFLRKLMVSLNEKGYIYVDLSYPKWSWHPMNRIMEMEISDDVVSFLLEQIEKIDADLQMGLKVASCLGASVPCSMLDILSKDIGKDLQNILEQVSQKGFMDYVNDAMFRFSHDKVQEASYELQSEQERRENHMRYGLAMCSFTLDTRNDDNDQIFFTSINQINRGGPGVLTSPVQRVMVAALNLKAGKRSIYRSDNNTAFQLFKHGISFLNKDHWETDYELSLKLFDAICDTACLLHKRLEVSSYTERLFAHARCDDDKLSCMLAVTRTLIVQGRPKNAIQNAFKMLTILGEQQPRHMDDETLIADMEHINNILQQTNNESLLNMEETNQKNLLLLMKVYFFLCAGFFLFEQSLFAATSLRMVELTIKKGFCLESPMAFAYYGQVLVSMGNLELGNRLGHLSLKLVEKNGSLRVQSQVSVTVYQNILWLSTPMQSIAEGNLNGYKAGQKSGELNCSTCNHMYFMVTSYLIGQCLTDLRKSCCDSALKMMHQGYSFAFQSCLLHTQVCVLIEGLHLQDARYVGNVPGVKEALAIGKVHNALSVPLIHAHRLVRTFLFRNFDDSSINVGLLSGLISQKKYIFRPIFLFGLFFEGLISFHYARCANNDKEANMMWLTKGEFETNLWLAKGEFVLRNMKLWSEHCSWNFENKWLLLEAERKFSLGELDEAESFYIRSMQSAREHQFVHEEAIASELAAFFFHERGLHTKSHSFFMHSLECYRKWGALAVARRVETTIQSKFGSNSMHLTELMNVSWICNYASEGYNSNKRPNKDSDDDRLG